MQGACPCGVCGERDGDSARRCTELVAPLRQEGFFRPPGGRPQGGEDDDDERAAAAKKLNGAWRRPPLRIGRHLIATTASRWPPATATVASASRR